LLRGYCLAAQLRPELATSRTRPRLHYLRTEQGWHEIDLIAELAGQRVLGIEVKASAAPTGDDAKHLPGYTTGSASAFSQASSCAQARARTS
jgi:hypothetical protein